MPSTQGAMLLAVRRRSRPQPHAAFLNAACLLAAGRCRGAAAALLATRASQPPACSAGLLG
jgi:hypothetical protein